MQERDSSKYENNEIKMLKKELFLALFGSSWFVYCYLLLFQLICPPFYDIFGCCWRNLISADV
jgi:hypothetical protein